ncbi:class I SAM-dependent methyltransferase [Salmonirosea aquatica]|uniref:class I SAM-dependent methyltransferase n=1 Tax=Salmonirosea aquatica TaxID=2654236 RepID=UPI003570ED5B
MKAKDNTVTEQVFQIVRCESCGFLFTNPRPTEQLIGSYYESTDYISHHDEGKDVMSRLYNRVREFTTQQKIKLLKKSIGFTGSLLDIGSGTGFFLSQAKAAGWQVAGTEPDAQARAISQGRVGEVIFESIQDPYFDTTTYDAITMWHVLEHVHLLNETFEWLHAHLSPKGRLIIAVPNAESEDARRFKEFWAAYDVPRHLYHFTKKSMTQLAEAHQFTVERIVPMWFDSYYVALLSNRYQQGKTNVPQSLWEGSVSNWKGRRVGHGHPNTSSLIYVLAKA